MGEEVRVLALLLVTSRLIHFEPAAVSPPLAVSQTVQSSSWSPSGTSGGALKPNGVIWCGDADSLAVRAIAERAAPILWFSPDEPLLVRGKPTSVTPGKLPFDTAAAGKSGVVYFQADPLKLRSGAAPQERGTIRLKDLVELRLRYFFYYPKDVGLHGHIDDLEGIDVTIERKEDKYDGCHEALRITRVVGHAHGSSLLANILTVADDVNDVTSMPVTILVEEGKHSSCPDKNGDGHYTPGYDVNRRATDAWGVRDAIRSSGLPAPAYDASMTKDRDEVDRVGPLTTVAVEDLYSSYLPLARLGPPTSFYELRDAVSWSNCTQSPDQRSYLAQLFKAEPFNLCNSAKEQGLGDPVVAATVTDSYSLGERGSIGMWFDFDHLLVGRLASAVEAPGIGGWLVLAGEYGSQPFGPENTGAGQVSTRVIDFDLGYSPSASRWADWYVNVSRRLQFDTLHIADTSHPEVTNGTTVYPLIQERVHSTFTEYEIGYRVRIEGHQQPFTVAVGLRWRGFASITVPRLFCALSIGPW